MTPHIFYGQINTYSAVVNKEGSQRYFRLVDHKDANKVIAESFVEESKSIKPYPNAEFILIKSCANVPLPVEE